MSLDVTTINQTNLWGKQVSNKGLEPQRSDLFMVDFKNAQKSVATVTKLLTMAPIVPHYIRSITWPETKLKPDVVRRDSNPYNMPSWDEPLDAIKISFLLDTNDGDNQSDVIQFLNAWLALTRAGRGARFQGFTNTTGFFTLNSDYTVDFMFNVNIYLLRGANINGQGFANNAADFNDSFVQNNVSFANDRRRAGLVQQGQPVPGYLDQQPIAMPDGNNAGSVFEQDLVIHSTYILHNAWLAGYKSSDLSHVESGLVSIDATFYADSIDLNGSGDNLTGEPTNLKRNATI